MLKLDVISKGRGKLRNQGSLLLVDNMVNPCASSPFELQWKPKFTKTPCCINLQLATKAINSPRKCLLSSQTRAFNCYCHFPFNFHPTRDLFEKRRPLLVIRKNADSRHFTFQTQNKLHFYSAGVKCSKPMG